jgi:hypothetical protein
MGVLLGSDEAIRHDNEVELPKRKAAHAVYEAERRRLSAEVETKGRAAANAFVVGVGRTKPELYRAALEAEKALAAHMERGIESGAATTMRLGSLEGTQQLSMEKGILAGVKRGIENGPKWIAEAEAGEAKLAAKKLDDEKAAKKAAASAKRAEKKAAVKKWAAQ